MAVGDLVLNQVQKSALLLEIEPATLQVVDYSTPSQKSIKLMEALYDTINAVTADGTPATAKKVILTSGAEGTKVALLARLNASTLEGGDFPSPFQKSEELAAVLHELISAIVESDI